MSDPRHVTRRSGTQRVTRHHQAPTCQDPPQNTAGTCKLILTGTPRARNRGRQMLPLARERLNTACTAAQRHRPSASRSHLFGQMRENHGEDMHIVGRKLSEVYMPVEPGSPLVAMRDVQMQSM
jgi:hypothetical protein